MRINSLLLTLGTAASLIACSSGANSLPKDASDVSLDQIVQADLDHRPLTPNERSYLRGLAHGVFGYSAHQGLMGRPEQAFVCVDQTQRDSVTPGWLQKAMIQDMLDDSTIAGYNIAIVAAYTLSKHFPCPNAPEFNPDGFTDALELLSRPDKSPDVNEP